METQNLMNVLRESNPGMTDAKVLEPIIYGLDALADFAEFCDYDTARTLEIIRRKFKPGDRDADEISDFLEVVNKMIIQANRHSGTYGKISVILQEWENEKRLK